MWVLIGVPMSVVIPRHRGGEVCFWPPLLWPRTFEKSTEDFFEKKPAAGEKFLGSLFWKILRFLGKNVKKLTFFSGFQWLHKEKKAAAGEKFGNPFFPRTFSFSSEDPLKKFGDDVCLKGSSYLLQKKNQFKKL